MSTLIAAVAKNYPSLIPFVYSTLVMLAVVESIKVAGCSGAPSKRSFNNTRKLLHILAGTIFIALWSKFPPASSDPSSPYWAAAVPLGITLKFAAVALGLLPSKSDVQLMSRTGDRIELLKGPTLYGVSIFCVTALGFKSIAASSAILAMCLGDGFAEVVGVACAESKVFDRRLDWNTNKTWAGFIACCIFSALSIFVSFYVASLEGWDDYLNVVRTHISFNEVLRISAVGGVLAGFVESVPIKDVDNVLLPLSVFVFVKSTTSLVGVK